MRLARERALLAAAGRDLLGGKLTVATGGNLSLCNRARRLVAITPSGMNYARLKPADVCVLDLQGRQVEGRRVPSSETPMHLCLFRAMPEVTALVHSHPPYCTAFAILREPIPAVHYLIPLMGNEIPVAEYATYGTEAMGPAALHALRASKAVLLPNHGLMVAGATLEQALNLSRIAEYVAHAYYLARTLGTPAPLPPLELDNLRAQFGHYGQVKQPGKRR
ncbi:class II aldolase/adducin family protein [bacterium]|nr:class II aldolase/adducin family protein [bacterium]